MQSQDLSTHAKTQTDQSEYGTYITSVIESGPIPNLFKTQLNASLAAKIQSTEYLTDDMFLGLGCSDGAIRVMSTSKGDIQYVLKSIDHSPVTCLSLNPNSANIKNSLIATHVDGTLEYWHATSQQLLFSKKYEQILHCCQISSDGHYYVFAGDKGHLKFGALSKGNPTDLEVGHMGAHKNRVFCLKWNPFDPNMFFSGGWDKTVFVWDIRTKTAAQKIFGVYMGGNAIDINKNNEILLGNNTNQMPLRIYDMKTSRARLLDWRPATQEQSHYTTGVMSCFFGQRQDEVVAASPGRDIRLFEGAKCVSRYENEDSEKKIYSMSKCLSKRALAVGWNNGDVQILNY